MNARHALAAVGLAAVVLAGAGYWKFKRSARRAPSAAVLAASASAAPSASSEPLPKPHPPRVALELLWPFPEPKPAVVPLAGEPEELPLRSLPLELRRAERARRAETAKGASPFASPYPPTCRPAARSPSRVFPRHGPVLVKPLSVEDLGPNRAVVRVTEDRDHLLPGDAVTVTVEVVATGVRTPFEVKEAELVKARTKDNPNPESVAVLAFNDDGKPPDAGAKDGVSTATISDAPIIKDYVGDLTARIAITTATESGEVMLPLARTGPPPAEFSGKVRESVENGSLALYVGIRVKTAGHYALTGRLYDSEHRAMAVLDANVDLALDTREVRFEAFGKLLRDLNVPGPWELRDVEGYLFGAIADRVDLLPMRVSKGPYRTRAYPLTMFSDQAWQPKTLPEPPPPPSATP